jgi:hypothetical protein
MASPTLFKAELIKLALQEAKASNTLRRGDQPLENRIDFYSRSVGISATPIVTAHYSAVFISWCMRTAGASATEFPAVASHWQYAAFALRNGEIGAGHFWARRIESYAPQLGDLVHFNRDGRTADFRQIGLGVYPAESGIVVAQDRSEASIIVGNQEPLGNIGHATLALDEKGLLIQRSNDPFICVIEVGK